jgi:hypothetical protein
MVCYYHYSKPPGPPPWSRRTSNWFPYDLETTSIANTLNDLQIKHKYKVLQYKQIGNEYKNFEKYSLIAKQKWINRNTTWATQNDKGYTNPNTKSLKRINGIRVEINPVDGTIIRSVGGTILPLTCIQAINNVYSNLPSNNNNNNNNNNNLPPLPPPSNNGNNIPSVPVIPSKPPKVIPDEGFLACSIIESICKLEF